MPTPGCAPRRTIKRWPDCTDVDYLAAQDETLEGLVQAARRIRGTLKSRAKIIAEALETYAEPGESGLEP